MMTLKLQVITLLFSFLFGFIFNLIITLLYKLIYNRNIIIQILSTLIITLSTTFAYFIMLKKINEAIISINEKSVKVQLPNAKKFPKI